MRQRYNERVTQYGAATADAFRRAWPLLISTALCLAGCKGDELGPTGVRLELRTADPSLLPAVIFLQWFDERDRILELRVPENGRLGEAQAAAAVVYIAMDEQTLGPRRVLVHGLRGEGANRDDPPISEGAMRVTPAAGRWTKVTVALEAAGTLPDADRDGLPDEIDNCPMRPDPCPDGPPDGGPPDGPAPDVAPPGDGADRPDQAIEVVPPADRADGAVDVPPDVALPPPDVPQEKPGPFNGNGTGVRGDYFDTATLTTLRQTRLDPNIDFNWMMLSPIPGLVGADTFSIRWTGFVQPRYSEAYTFFAVCDDGVRVFLNNAMVIDGWAGPANREFTTTPTMLTAGDKIDLRVEYFENTGSAACRFSWQSASQVKEAVPTSQLYPPMLDGGI
jgi:hypothetical protein